MNFRTDLAIELAQQGTDTICQHYQTIQQEEDGATVFRTKNFNPGRGKAVWKARRQLHHRRGCSVFRLGHRFGQRSRGSCPADQGTPARPKWVGIGRWAGEFSITPDALAPK